jgi:FeS assembly SUF system regulator
MLRMTKLADYGIVLMTHFASARPGRVFTARDLAGGGHVPLPTASKILKALSHAGLLVSHRGAGGGFALARPAAEVTVAEIISALEGPIALTECIGEPAGTCDIERLCPTRTNWERINGVVREALEGLTLADMARPWWPKRSATAAGAASGGTSGTGSPR